MDSTPASLLERLQRPGDAAAWERFVTLYTPLMYHWLRRTGLGADDVADLVQEVLTKLVVHLPRFAYNADRSFHAWLRTLVMNSCRDLLRRRTPPGEAAAGEFVPDPLEEFIQREYRQQLAVQALRILQRDFKPPTWQAVWDLVVEGKPAAEVAAAHGMTPAAVYAAKCRVLARLRAELHGLWA